MAAKQSPPVEAPGAQESAPEPITLRSHPAAMASIRRVRARAGLGALILVLVLSLHAGVLLPSAAARALAAGVAVQLVAWKIAVVVWRQIVLMQVQAVEEQRRERRRRRAEALARAQGAVASAADSA